MTTTTFGIRLFFLSTNTCLVLQPGRVWGSPAGLILGANEYEMQLSTEVFIRALFSFAHITHIEFIKLETIILKEWLKLDPAQCPITGLVN